MTPVQRACVTSISLPLSRLIHENLSIIVDFCFSRPGVDEMLKSFLGEWKYLHKTVYEVSEARAEKAALELALFLRMLDDREGLSEYLRQTDSNIRYGSLHMRGGGEKQLKMRDVANKIIHASHFEWAFSDPKEPRLICHAPKQEKWTRAEIQIVAVAAICGQLMH
jgi:hypothetical protein